MTEARNLFELIHKSRKRSSTIFCSQFRECEWYQPICSGESTVYHYLTYLLEKMANDSMGDDELEMLAPWNEDVKSEIERRVASSNQ